jgi:chromosome segregation ATPase
MLFLAKSPFEGTFVPRDEPECLALSIFHILSEMRAEMATKNDVADLRSEMRSLRADVASDLATLDAKVDRTRKDLSDQIVGLRRAVVEYHTSAIGHGVLISELEARLRRVEQRLDLQPDLP